jgi:hypothetical protein
MATAKPVIHGSNVEESQGPTITRRYRTSASKTTQPALGRGGSIGAQADQNFEDRKIQDRKMGFFQSFG